MKRREFLSRLSALPVVGWLFKPSEAKGEEKERLWEGEWSSEPVSLLTMGGCESDNPPGELLMDYDEGITIVRYPQRSGRHMDILTIDTNRYVEVARQKGPVGGRCCQVVVGRGKLD